MRLGPHILSFGYEEQPEFVFDQTWELFNMVGTELVLNSVADSSMI